MKLVELASITHQGKALKMLREVGAIWRPKTRPKNKLRLNMKKLLNPKLAEKKVAVIEDSSSHEKLEDSEDENKEVKKDKKPIVPKDKPVFIDTKISDIFMEVRNKMIQEQQQNDIKSSYMDKREAIEDAIQCSIEAEEHSEIPVTLTEHMKEDEEIFKNLKNPMDTKRNASNSRR